MGWGEVLVSGAADTGDDIAVARMELAVLIFAGAPLSDILRQLAYLNELVVTAQTAPVATNPLAVPAPPSLFAPAPPAPPAAPAAPPAPPAAPAPSPAHVAQQVRGGKRRGR